MAYGGDDMSERQALLTQDPAPRPSRHYRSSPTSSRPRPSRHRPRPTSLNSRPRLANFQRGDGGSSSDESASRSGSDNWWGGSGSETGSSSSSFCSASDSELEWESEVTERGELFYVESHVGVQSKVVDEAMVGPSVAAAQPVVPFVKKRRSTKAKLLRLIRRRNSRRQKSKAAISGLATLGAAATSASLQEASDVPNTRNTAANKVTFHDWQEGEAREVILNVDPCAPHNLGRRATLTETLLGLIIATFADGQRIMVSGFVPQGEALKHRGVKIGDWLQSVDGQRVTGQTIEMVLAAITVPCKVNLKLQRVAGCEVAVGLPKETPLHSEQKSIYQSTLVQHLVGNIGPAHKEQLVSLFLGRPIGVLYLALEGMSETGPADQGVVYCYPSPVASNPMGVARGSFLTLHHLVPELATTPPVSSTCLLQGELMHVTYTAQSTGDLLLLALPNAQCSLQEALRLTADVVRSLQFSHQTLHSCFSDATNHPSLDHQFSLFFARLLAGGLLPPPSCPAPLLFEDTMLAARWLTLPRETQALLDEALSELEASDFRDVNDDLNSYQRLFSITGSCLFHRGYLLSSHLQHPDLIDVVSFCRQQGLLDLSCREAVRSLVLWRRVYLASCERGLQAAQTAISPYRLPDGKWFLLIVGTGHEMLVVLMESGGCTIRSDGDCGPDIVYVEQVQDILLRIQRLGIIAVAAQCINKCARPQPCQPEHITLHKATSPGFLNLAPTKLASAVLSTSSSFPNTASKKIIPEVTSILKRRVPSPDRSTNTALLSDRSPNLSGLTLGSEDSASQTASLAESDEAPILGRRAERERDRLSDSDSESDCYRSDNRNFESEKRQSKSVLAGLENILPSKLTAGEENVMFHYVHLDLTEGILMCPPTHREVGHSQRLTEILHNFRLSAQVIHTLLQNTVHFKKLAGHEVSKARVNKSLVAIKEHGVLLECSAGDLENMKKVQPFTYWVIGRLFFTPQPREVYVCHHDSVPQNMVEIAFRLGLSAAG